MRCMVSALGVVVRFSMNVRVDNGSSADNVRMRKERCTCVETYIKRYEKERYYFFYSNHTKPGTKVTFFCQYMTVSIDKNAGK